MRKTTDHKKNLSCLSILFCLSLGVFGWLETARASQAANEDEQSVGPNEKSEIDLKAIPFKIIYETFRETDGKENWELFLMNADGSNATNLTRTPDVDEMCPHASPDGAKICFVTDEKQAKSKVRNVYYMNIDGTGRVKVADNAREPCWSPDGKMIAYLKGEYERYTSLIDTKGLFFYDIATGRHKQHPNKELHHIYNVCWSPNGKWFVASVIGGMGFGHAIIAFEANGTAVFDLAQHGVGGCRPDLSSDGRKMAWGQTDSVLYVGDIDLTLSVPRMTDLRAVVRGAQKDGVAHTDFSPDGRYLAFGYEPHTTEQVGGKAPGYHICVSDLSGKWVQITTDGKSNEAPDWVPIREGGL
jgi:Tol biopolymer transport system component